MDHAGHVSTPKRAMGSRIVCATPRKGNALINYSLGEKIGRGAFANVYKAIDVKTGMFVAIKQIPISKLKSVDTILSEIELLQDLEHPNIVKYLGSMKMEDTLNIVLEYCENGSLSSICSKFGVFPENLVATYMSQVLEGLIYLHNQGTIHRDIKGANILTTKDGTAKLADFGVATTVSTASGESIVGTPHWIAPEIVQLQEPTPSCDIWSLGCTAIELRTGSPPYAELTDFGAMYAMVENDSPPLPLEASRSMSSFLTLCFQKNPRLRSTASDLKQHVWIRKHNKAAVPKPSETFQTLQEYSDLRQRSEKQQSKDVPSDAKPSSGALNAYVDTTGFSDGFHTPPKLVLLPPTNNGNSKLVRSPLSDRSANVSPLILKKQKLEQPRPLSSYEDESDLEELAEQILRINPDNILKKVQAISRTNEDDPFSGVEDFATEASISERSAAAQEEALRLLKVVEGASENSVPSLYTRLAELVALEPHVKKLLLREGILRLALPVSLKNQNSAAPILDLIYSLSVGDEPVLDSLSLAGGLSTILSLSRAHSLSCLKLLQEFCVTYQHGPRLLICRDDSVEELCWFLTKYAPSLTGSLGDDENGEILRLATSCILSIFEQMGPRKRTELWFLFGPKKLFEKLVSLLSMDESHPAYPHVFALLDSFARVPPKVITQFATRHSLRQIMSSFRHLPRTSPYRNRILHFYKELSNVPEVINLMERGELAPHFIYHLRELYASPKSSENRAAAVCLLPLLYNYCRLSGPRLQEAAKWGLVPLLLDVTHWEPTLKEFSLPLVCAMAHTGGTCWKELSRYDALAVLKKLINEPGWEASAVSAITAWVTRDSEDIAQHFISLGGLTGLCRALSESRSETFTAVITSMATLVDFPIGVRETICAEDVFESLGYHLRHAQNSTTLVKVLQVIRKVIEAQPRSCKLLISCGLAKTLGELCEQDELSVMCKRLAKTILTIAGL